MKKLLFIFQFCLLTGFVCGQNNAIRGIVKLQNSGAQPLANVKISSFGTNAVYSNSSGMYEMVFNGKKPGSSVSLLIQMTGYEVINEKELERCVIRENPDDLVFIIMAKQGERNKQALAYYNIIVSNTNNSFNKELKNIKGRLDALDEDDEDRQVLRSQIDVLQQEKEALINKAEDLARQLATVDLDRASSIAQEAYQKFQEGDVKAALIVLDDESLDKSLQEAQAEKMALETKLLKADSALQQSIENFMIKARFCISDGQYNAAFDNYFKAINADSTHVDNLWELADYCASMKQQKKAIVYYKKALDNVESDPSIIRLLAALGEQFRFDDNYEKAKASLKSALEATINLENIDADRSRQEMAFVKNSWGLLYLDLSDFPSAKTSLGESLDLYEELVKEDSLKYQPLLANVLRNAGAAYARTNDYGPVEGYYLRALSIYSQLAVEDPQTYERQVTRTKENLGSMYSSMDNFEKAEETFLEVLDAYKKLVLKNPTQYEEYIADIKSKMFILYSRNGHIEEAEKAVNDALAIYTRLADVNPERYEFFMATSLGDMALLNWNKGDLVKTKDYFLKSLAISTPLAEQNPQKYQTMVARMKSNLAVTYKYLGEFKIAESTYNEVLDIYRPLVALDSQYYQLRLCYPLVNIAFLKQSLLEKSLDRKYQKEGMKILEEVKQLLSIYDPNINEVKALNTEVNNLETYFENLTDEDLEVIGEINKIMAIDSEEPKIEKRALVLESIESALTIYADNQRLTSFAAEYYGNLSWTLITEGQFAQAEEAARRGLSIDVTQEWIKRNLAPALLFQNKYQEAETLYLELKDKPKGNQTYSSSFLADLASLEKDGINHNDVPKIRSLLK